MMPLQVPLRGSAAAERACAESEAAPRATTAATRTIKRGTTQTRLAPRPYRKRVLLEGVLDARRPILEESNAAQLGRRAWATTAAAPSPPSRSRAARAA